MGRKRIKQHSCANCGFEFKAESEKINYCPNCGQENHNPRFPLIHYGYELLEGFLHFDIKFFYSFKVLLFNPGKLTKDYINNIRGRYTPPLRLFIFISVFALLIMSIFEKNMAKSGYFGSYAEEAIQKNLTISEIFDQSSDSTIDYILVPPFSWVMHNPEITNADLRVLKNTSPDSVGTWLTKYGYHNNPITRFYALNKKLRISRHMTVPEANVMISGIFKKLFLIMIPVSAFIFFILFYRRKLLYYDALLYSIHFTSFFLILYSILLIEILLLIKVNQFLLLILSIINLLILAVYLAVSLKKVFGHTWLCTIIRMTFASLILFTLYQFIHYTISFNSGR
ncbi:MAG TPA: DUF3667 domain-containing protein [Chitinophagales bacterium]|nr:DUF3667 domain-containing protein [Chitinophagales bacterium]